MTELVIGNATAVPIEIVEVARKISHSSTLPSLHILEHIAHGHRCQREDDTDEESIPYDKMAKVIDGQHRIASFMDEDGNWQYDKKNQDFEINLSIFPCLTGEDEIVTLN